MRNDKEILSHIIYSSDSPDIKSNMMNILRYAVKDSEPVYTQTAAILFMSVNTKGKEIINVIDLLNNNLLPHYKDHKQKAFFLAQSTRKILLTHLGVLSTTDRDSYANKHIDLSGSLLLELYRELWGNYLKNTSLTIDHEYKFNFKETVKEERKVSRRNVFDILVEKPAEEPVALVEEPQPLTISQVEVPETVEEKFSQSDVDGLEKFADRILKKYDIDVEFTRHFVDRLNDPRNKPEIKVAELQRFFKKIQKNKGKDIRQNPDVEVVLKDLASDINLPVVINYKDGEFEVVNKTVMRKKDFKTPDKVIKYEEVEETVEEVVEDRAAFRERKQSRHATAEK